MLRVAYAECYLNKIFAERLINALNLSSKVIHKENMNFERVLARLIEVLNRDIKDYELVAAFPDKEEEYQKRVSLERVLESLKRKFEGKGVTCKRRQQNPLDVLVCEEKRNIRLLVVSFEGGIEKALIKVGVKEGTIERYKRELKGGKVPKSVERGLEELVKRAKNLIKGHK